MKTLNINFQIGWAYIYSIVLAMEQWSEKRWKEIVYPSISQLFAEAKRDMEEGKPLPEVPDPPSPRSSIYDDIEGPSEYLGHKFAAIWCGLAVVMMVCFLFDVKREIMDWFVFLFFVGGMTFPILYMLYIICRTIIILISRKFFHRY